MRVQKQSTDDQTGELRNEAMPTPPLLQRIKNKEPIPAATSGVKQGIDQREQLLVDASGYKSAAEIPLCENVNFYGNLSIRQVCPSTMKCNETRGNNFNP